MVQLRNSRRPQVAELSRNGSLNFLMITVQTVGDLPPGIIINSFIDSSTFLFIYNYIISWFSRCVFVCVCVCVCVTDPNGFQPSAQIFSLSVMNTLVSYTSFSQSAQDGVALQPDFVFRLQIVPDRNTIQAGAGLVVFPREANVSIRDPDSEKLFIISACVPACIDNGNCSIVVAVFVVVVAVVFVVW